MEKARWERVPTQEVSLWIAGALVTLAWFGFLTLLAAQVENLDLGDRLFGLFHVSLLHNFIHLLLGVAAVVAARSYRVCRRFLTTAGTVILVLAGYGQIDAAPELRDLVPVGTADGALHLVLGLAMLTASLLPAEPFPDPRRLRQGRDGTA